MPLFGDVRRWVAYPLIPWIGIMAAGYGCGLALKWDQADRQRRVFLIGLAITIAFVGIRGLDGDGDPPPGATQPDPFLTVLNFLACEKYPMSYVLMTMGPALLLLAALDRRIPSTRIVSWQSTVLGCDVPPDPSRGIVGFLVPLSPLPGHADISTTRAYTYSGLRRLVKVCDQAGPGAKPKRRRSWR